MAPHRKLSSPGEASVNDGIDPDKFPLHYIKLDQVIRLVSKLGPGPSWPDYLMLRQLITTCLYTPPIASFWG